jgi:hypothetical protein
MTIYEMVQKIGKNSKGIEFNIDWIKKFARNDKTIDRPWAGKEIVRLISENERMATENIELKSAIQRKKNEPTIKLNDKMYSMYELELICGYEDDGDCSAYPVAMVDTYQAMLDYDDKSEEGLEIKENSSITLNFDERAKHVKLEWIRNFLEDAHNALDKAYITTEI